VFRDLVVTGRPRLALFAARVPAGLALLLPIGLAAFAITATASIVFAGSLEVSDSHAVIDYRAPGASLLLQSAGWLALVTAVSFALALGVSSLQGSAGPSIGILLGLWLVVMPVLMNTASLGSLRGTIAMAALDRLAPAALIEGTPVVPMSIAAAVVVVLAWTAVPLALGAWRTSNRTPETRRGMSGG
jgi:hypothetical protein